MLGLGNMDPAKMDKMLKKLNIDMKNIKCSEVVIKTEGHDIVITEPDVSVIRMQGRDVFQVTGNIIEKPTTVNEKINKEDVRMIMEQTGRDRETVEKTLERLNNDLARAIIELKKTKD